MPNNEYYHFERKELFPFIPHKPGIVLDVGCGAGVFGKAIKDYFNCKAWGIEPEDVALDAKQKLDKVFQSTFNDNIDFGNQKFDVIFFNDVLEHMVAPDEALTLAKQLLSKNGKIIASIPNIMHNEAIWKILKERDWKYEEAGIMDKTHLRFFTKKSIKRLFNDAGLEVEMIEGINPHYGQIFRWLNFILLKRFEEMKFIQFAVVSSPSK